MALAALFSSADELRRRQGEALERLGFGPKTTPARLVRRFDSLELMAYQAPDRGGAAVLIVPAPIKTAYIWDLAPGASVVQRLRESGMHVYLIAWQRPQPGDEGRGLEEYAGRAIEGCLDAIEAESEQSKIFLAGHSLGGTLAAIFSSLHPDRVRGLVTLEGPIEFGRGRFEAALAAAPRAPAITRALGNVPGTFLDLASAYADPLTFNGEPWLDWLGSSASPQARRLHWRVRRWSLDETAMTQKLFEEVQEGLYRENRFARGVLRVEGRLAEPRAIRAPILAVMDSRSRIVPPSSIEAYRRRTGSGEVEILDYRGDTGVVMQHVGVLVGPRAHESLWPRICTWLRAH